MMNPPNQNQNPMRRGFSRNGAPQGYGQQRGYSPYLDREQRQLSRREEEMGDQAPPASSPNAPAAPHMEALQRPSQRGMGVQGGGRRYWESYGDDWSGNRQADLSQDTPEESQARADMMGFGRPQPAAFQRGYGAPEQGYGPGGVQNPAYRGPAQQPQAAPNGDDQAWRMSLRQRALSEGGPGQNFGWNTGDYGGDEGAATSMKNTFHALSRRYANTPSGLRQLVQDPDFKRAFPNARIVEHPTGDKIDFGGQVDWHSGEPVGIVDVGRAFNGETDTGEGWDWMPEMAGGGGFAGGAPAPQGGPQDLSGYQFDPQAQALLAALQGGNQDNFNVSIEEILKSLGMGGVPQV